MTINYSVGNIRKVPLMSLWKLRRNGIDKARTNADLDNIAWSKLADEYIRFIRKQK